MNATNPDSAKIHPKFFENDAPSSGYPLNCWWVAATRTEVGRKPLSRRLLERSIVLFRTESANVVALDDRCAHRGALLSHGRLLKDEIACPYHGFRYDARGVCIHIPTQTHIPADLKVRSYPVCEHGPFVWIWAGVAAKADTALLPEIQWPPDQAGMRFGSHGVVQCNYQLVHENSMDLAHILFLHGSAESDWLKYGDSPRALQSSTTIDETNRGLLRTIRLSNAEPIPLDAKTLGFAVGQRINSLNKSTFFPPGCFFKDEVNELIDAPAGMRGSYGYRGVHCTTPISSNSCHWWWAYTYDFAPEASAQYLARWEAILKEDSDLLEAMQTTLDSERRGVIPADIFVLADRGPAVVRKILQKMLETEAATNAGAQP